jgi:hypothetical protein
MRAVRQPINHTIALRFADVSGMLGIELAGSPIYLDHSVGGQKSRLF